MRKRKRAEEKEESYLVDACNSNMLKLRLKVKGWGCAPFCRVLELDRKVEVVAEAVTEE